MPWFLWVIIFIPIVGGIIVGFLPDSGNISSGISGIGHRGISGIYFK
jgi:hypothetical protein